jgi:putative transposase
MRTKFDPQKHHRRSIRLKDFDYTSEGAYFVTIVTWGREYLFGEIVEKEMYLSRQGEIVQKWWDDIPMHFPNVETGAFVIMPNHIHGIISIDERRERALLPHNHGGETSPLHKPTLGQIIAYFKYQSTKEMNPVDNIGTITKLWQRNYYELIIRNEKELKQKTHYILDNPSHWDKDQDNPKNKKTPSS